VLNLYQHVNSPEARLYLSRQLFEEAVHVQFNLTLLDTYVPDEAERAQAFAAVENISSIARKARFCFTWIDSVYQLRELRTERADNHFISAERNAAHVRSLQRRHVDITSAVNALPSYGLALTTTPSRPALSLAANLTPCDIQHARN
jgi:hypothetical protein